MEFIDKIEKTFSKADYDRIMAAYDFAAIAHANTYRKGTRIPYIKHPIEAAEVVLEMTSDPSIIIATLLHDVVEDTHYSIADIQERFGGRVAELVSYETEDKRKGQKESDTWKIRKEEFLEHLSRCPIEAKMITIGDKVSNLRAMKKDYENLGEKLWERFNQKNPVEQGWYYISIKNMTKELQDYSAWCEYEKLCGELFGFMESL